MSILERRVGPSDFTRDLNGQILPNESSIKKPRFRELSLQSDLNRLDAWSKDSGLTLNETKCKAQRISRKLKPIESSYSIKGKVLESVVTERDLGVFVANDLTWSKQVLEQSCRANKLSGLH